MPMEQPLSLSPGPASCQKLTVSEPLVVVEQQEANLEMKVPVVETM